MQALVLGAYLANKPNLVEHIVDTLASARECSVEQRWVALNGAAPSTAVEAVTCDYVDGFVPKFTLMNRLLRNVDLSRFDFIILCDDDIALPPDFLDQFLQRQLRFDFALAQPARRRRSGFDHRIVRRNWFCAARETRFVEIGPLVSMDRRIAPLLIPFDEASAMGWGYDLHWPVVVQRHGLKMGIIDATPIDHTLRPQANTYSRHTATASMAAYLSNNDHLVAKEAFVTLKRHFRWHRLDVA